MNKQTRRQELSAFLKQRRAGVTPAAVGLPPGTRRRTPGLRREEVAQLAGVGTTWYTWLEQGREIQVSVQVLGSIARVLQLSDVERWYLFELARQDLPPIPTQPLTPVSASLQLLLDTQHHCPAYIMGWRWDVLAWNQLARLILIDFEELPVHNRNLLWLMFGHEPFRARLLNWPLARQTTLAHFRASCAPYLGNPALNQLIERLQTTSPEFQADWEHQEVMEKRHSRKEFNHPDLGHLTFDLLMLQSTDPPGAKLVLLLPEPNSSTWHLLKQLEAIELSEGNTNA